MFRERWRTILTGVLIVGFAVALVLDGRSGGGPVLGAPAPEFELPALDGRTVSLGALRGKVVLLDFWATWCASCVRKLPLLDRLRDELGAQGLEVLAINVDGDREATQRYAEKSQLQVEFLLARQGVSSRYGVRALPHVVLVDRQGRVAYSRPGGGSFPQLRTRVVAALRAAPAATPAQKPGAQKR